MAIAIGIPDAKAIGTAVGVATASGVGASIFVGIGSSAGSANTNIIANSRFRSTFSSLGAANTTFTSNSRFRSSFASVGAANTDFTGTSVAISQGTASGSSSTSFVGASIFRSNFTSVASSSGLADGIARTRSVFSSVGAANSNAIGESLVLSQGTALGNSTASAFGRSKATSSTTANGAATSAFIGHSKFTSNANSVAEGDSNFIGSARGSAVGLAEGNSYTDFEYHGFFSAIGTAIGESEALGSSIVRTTQSATATAEGSSVCNGFKLINYQGTGGLTFKAQTRHSYSIYVEYKWGENSVLYSKQKAKRGMLERAVIKRVNLKNRFAPIYIDNFNSYWNEDDLIREDEAREIISEYQAKFIGTTEETTVFALAVEDTNGVEFSGAASTAYSIYFEYKWGENSIVYVKDKARRGILERVAIKRVVLNSGPKTYDKIIPVYVDTLNSYWNEDDLILEDEARDLISDYIASLSEPASTIDGVVFSGKAKTSFSLRYSYRWGENSIVYVKNKAKKGILERVAIKSVLFNKKKNKPYNYRAIIPVYIDTLNSYWNEDDLILEDEARELATAYLEQVAENFVPSS